jgi:hypothetical protein
MKMGVPAVLFQNKTTSKRVVGVIYGRTDR